MSFGARRLPLVILAAACACAPTRTSTAPVAGSESAPCVRVAHSGETLPETYRDVLLVEIRDGLYSCTCERRVRGLTEARAPSGLAERRGVQGLTEERNPSGLVEERRVRGLTEERSPSGLVEERKPSGAAEQRGVQGITDENEVACVQRSTCSGFVVESRHPPSAYRIGGERRHVVGGCID
jgi:hypothetical protein